MSSLLKLEYFYVLCGVGMCFVGATAALDPHHPKRWGTGAFWAIIGIMFMAGHNLSDLVDGYLVLAVVALAATGQVKASNRPDTRTREREASAERLGNRLFIPALAIPAFAIAGSLILARLHFGSVWLLEPTKGAIISLCLGAAAAVLIAMPLTKAKVSIPLREGSQLILAVGWALILPQLLAALGGIFLEAGLGQMIADGISQVLPVELPGVAVIAYCVGMAVFTIFLGNAFAAFAVVTGGIGLPLVVQRHGGNPAIMAGLGMLAGYCGTLVTPMAANFNLVPVILLELKDRNAVIKAQLPMAAVIFVANGLILYFCVYHFK